MSEKRQEIKMQIVKALSHPEAEDGLYLDNMCYLHEEDERQKVAGSELEILDALKELIAEGKVKTDDSKEQVVFLLNR